MRSYWLKYRDSVHLITRTDIQIEIESELISNYKKHIYNNHTLCDFIRISLIKIGEPYFDGNYFEGIKMLLANGASIISDYKTTLNKSYYPLAIFIKSNNCQLKLGTFYTESTDTDVWGIDFIKYCTLCDYPKGFNRLSIPQIIKDGGSVIAVSNGTTRELLHVNPATKIIYGDELIFSYFVRIEE